MHKVSIIIVNWNGLKDTVECLESLKNITYPNYEVIVVDNGSEQNDAEVLRAKWGGYIYVIENDKNYGFPEGANIGIRHALEASNPDYILLLNNDTVVDREFLTELVKIAESDEKIGIVGPKVCNYYIRNKIDAAGGMVNWLLGFGEDIGEGKTDVGQFNQLKEVDYVSGSVLLIKSGVIKEIGLLDGGFFLYNEDADWCLRARKGGYKILYTPMTTVFHKQGASTKRVEKKTLYYSHRNRILLLSKHATKKQLILAFLPMFIRFISALGYYFVRGKLPCVLAIGKAYYDGILAVLSHTKR